MTFTASMICRHKLPSSITVLDVQLRSTVDALSKQLAAYINVLIEIAEAWVRSDAESGLSSSKINEACNPVIMLKTPKHWPDPNVFRSLF